MKATLSFDFNFDNDGDCDLLQHLAEQIKLFPARRRDSGDVAVHAVSGDVVNVASGDVITAGSGDDEPERRQVNGDASSATSDTSATAEEMPGPIARAKARGRKAVAVAEPPAPPTTPPVEGKAANEDVSGPDDEEEENNAFGLGSEDEPTLTVQEARDAGSKYMQEVFFSGSGGKAEVKEYRKELGINKFSEIDDDRAHAMYRKSVELMHSIGRPA